MRILLASSELFPYSKTGGLADMVSGLSKMLARMGHRVGIVTPLYKGIAEKFPEVERMEWEFSFFMGAKTEKAGLRMLSPEENLTIYFVDHPEFYHRDGIYMHDGELFPDNGERYIFFSKCVANLARYLPWQPQVVSLHDWQGGLVPALLHHQREFDGAFHSPPTCYTIHNLAYQGAFPESYFDLTQLPPSYFSIDGLEFYGQMNCMKSGIQYADVITTVSPNYAREIATKELGCGLEGVLQERHEDLVGILNGVDYDEWNTANNPHLKHAYSVNNIAGKTRNKKALQKELGLKVDAAIPVFGTVTRLTEQKGVDILLDALGAMLSNDLQFVMLGSGDPKTEANFSKLAERFPDKVAIHFGYSQALAHQIEAGIDFFLMPSRFEPCGLNQMYSLRYGSVPIVRATGGLDDSVIDESENPKGATGIKFQDYSSTAVVKAMQRALDLYKDKKALKRYRQNGMAADFSLENNAAKFVDLFEKILAKQSG